MDHLIFADEAISPAGLRLLSREISRRGLKLKWACRCKLERAFTRELFDLAAAAGCTEILFGLETISEPLQRRMGKHVPGLDAAAVRRMLGELAAAGIGVHLNLINGFPGETLGEAEATADFVVDALRSHPGATYLLNPFTLFPATPMAEDPAAFGIANVAPGGDMPPAYAVAFDAETEGATGPARRAFGALARRLDEDLGWAGLRRTEAGRAATTLYFASGHSAVFKSLARNPLDPVARASPNLRRDRPALRRVAVTGANGVAGRAVTEALLAEGMEVLALVRRAEDADARCTPIIGELAALGDWADAVAGADAVVHCASPRSLEPDLAAAEIAWTAALIAAWRAGPFVGMSSQTVYGVPRGRLAERSPVRAESWYDVAKLEGEKALARASGTGGRGPGVSLRLPLLFGAGQDRQFLPPILEALHAGRTFVFDDEAAMRRHGSVYIGEADLGRAVLAALGVRRGGAYNLAGGFVTWDRLLHALGDLTGARARLAFRQGPAAADELRLPHARADYDLRRFTRATGFTPTQTLDEILAISLSRGEREGPTPERGRVRA